MLRKVLIVDLNIIASMAQYSFSVASTCSYDFPPILSIVITMLSKVRYKRDFQHCPKQGLLLTLLVTPIEHQLVVHILFPADVLLWLL